MSEYPNNIFSQREIENVPGQTYDSTKKTRIYAEDLTALGAEVNAIETTLGTNPEGSSETVKERLENIEANLGRLHIEEGTGTVGGGNTVFTFNNEPFIILVKGQAFLSGYGFTLSGTGPYTATLSIAPFAKPIGLYY